MMDLRIRIFIIIAMICLIIGIVAMIRKKKLELRYALIWLFVGMAVLILSIFPVLMEGLSYLFGIASPMNMLFFFGFCFSLIIIFVLTVALSRMSTRIKNLAQDIALQDKRHQNQDQEQK